MYMIFFFTCFVSGNEDFEPVLTELTFSAGATLQVVSLPTIDDEIAESPEHFEAMLLSPSDSLTMVGPMSSAMITIDDDDGNCLSSSLK